MKRLRAAVRCLALGWERRLLVAEPGARTWPERAQMGGVLGTRVDGPPVAGGVFPPTSGHDRVRAACRSARAGFIHPSEAGARVGAERVAVDRHDRNDMTVLRPELGPRPALR